MILRGCLLTFCLLLSPVWGEQRPKMWEKTVPGEILAVVNADSNRVTGQAMGGETVSTANQLIPDSESGTFQVVGSPHGVLLLAVNDKTQYVQLVALDIVTGEKLWQVACTGLPVTDLPELPAMRTTRATAEFVSTRNEVVALQRSESGQMLVAYDIRTGVELWRSAAGGADPNEMLKQMQQLMPKGRMAKMMEGQMAAFQKTQSVASSFYLLPQRNLLMKVYPEMSGGVMEAVDLDTGQQAWLQRWAATASNVDVSKLMANARAKAADRTSRKKLLREAQDIDATTAGAMMGNSFRGDRFLMGCTGRMAEAMQESGAGTCPPLQVYDTPSGRLAWEFREGEAQGWLASANTALVRTPGKVVALKLATGEKLYEVSGAGAAAIDSGFTRITTYSSGAWIYWLEPGEKNRNLVALDARAGTVAWRAPVPKQKVDLSTPWNARGTSFLVWEKVLAVATGNEIILIDRASGRVLGREKALGGDEIRAASPLDARSMVVVGDMQMRRFEVDPWREVYATRIPEPRSSVFAEVLAMGLAVAAMSVQVSVPGPSPGTFVRVPYAMTPMGMVTTNRLLASLDSPSLTKLEQRSASYTYFNSGDAIHRVEVLTGSREKVASTLKKGSTFAIDESRGIGCLIRGGTLTAYQVPMEDAARRVAQYGDGMEIGFSESRRAEKLEASDKAKAGAAYLSAVKGFSSALAASEEGREKAVLHLALGQAYDRLSVVSTQESAASWKEKAAQEYQSAASATSTGAATGLEGLCQTATERLQGKSLK